MSLRQMRGWLVRLAGLFSREKREREFAEELESHLQMHIADNLRSGMTEEEARRQALLKLGGVTSTRQAYRERGTIPFIGSLRQDLRFAARQLRKNPVFASTAIVILALGICASVAIFAFVDSALIKPLPYQDPTRLVGVYESVGMIPHSNLSYPDYLDWKRLNHVFSSLEVWNGTGYMLSTPAGIQLVPGIRVSDGFFRTLGVSPVLGRDFYAGEDLPEAPRTVILSYPAWQKWFGGKADVVGQVITLSDIPYTVIGVLPREFQFAPRGRAEFWTTLHPSGPCDLRRSCHNLYGIGRLKDGVSVQAALAEMTSIAQDLERQYPDSNRGQGAAVVALSEAIVGDIRPIFLILLSGAGLLMLIACVNVAGLLLVRSESRKREIAVRCAMGASTARLIYQFGTESLILVVIGGALGLVSAGWTMRLLLRLIPADMAAAMPYLQDLGINFRVAAFAVLISVLAALFFALIPTLQLSLSDLREGLTESSRGSTGMVWSRFGSNLVVLELAIAVVLLVGAGLLGKSFYHLLHVENGLQPDHLATLQVVAPEARYGKDEQAVALGRRVVNAIVSLPGVESVGISTQLPLSGNGNTTWIRIVGQPYDGEHNEVNERHVSSDYFTTLRARLLRGRYFNDAEDASKSRVVIINRALERQYFPGEDAIGKKIGDTGLSPDSIMEIVGVVGDIREGSLDEEIWPAIYVPFNQGPDTYFSVVARTSQAEQSLLPTLVAAIRQIDAGIGMFGESTMSEQINNSQTAYLRRSLAWLVGGFAVLALLLSVVGLYGVVSYTVAQRTKEIGIRMVLGAQPREMLRLVISQGMKLALAGVVLGLAGAFALTRLMQSLLYEVSPSDPLTLALVSLLLTGIALAACFVPARRAAKVDPMIALRYE